ncbi:MAG: hypothetical protein OXE99_07615 [Cellvibrionales bacterium]|nr:hypothetical protein [Cellvibrionales bacterium]
MLLSMPSNRLSAAGIHLLISLVIFAGILGLFYFIWFPGAFLQVGGTEGLAMLAGVDLVLGPLLTLIVYNKAKKSLKWDLSFIATLQVVCLIAGLWVIEKQRPLAQIVVNDKVHVFTKEDLIIRNISLEKIQSMPGAYPKPIFVDLPLNQAARKITIATSFLQGALEARENSYLPLSEADAAFFSDFQQDTQGDCYEVSLLSEHYEGKACLSITEGVTHLINDKV